MVNHGNHREKREETQFHVWKLGVSERGEEKKNILFDGHSNGVTYKSKW